ncbi:MAG: formylglycine-generating enzyme family protein [Polyangia bacterium]
MTGGVFQMGSTEGGFNEIPVHEVTVPDFEMLETEVTVSQYAACVAASVCSEPSTEYTECNWNETGYEDHPVNCVDWNQAIAFCQWIGGRLPSEAEWEYAARSEGQDITYPWGDETATCDYTMMDDGGDGCGTGRTWSVCSKTAGNTDQGLCDMAGNVYEWVQDVYHGLYDCDANPGQYNCSVGGVAPTDGSAWEDSGSVRVLRGGSFYGGADILRAAYRLSVYPSSQSDYMGVRCAREAP